jgi:hypothetical protein
VQVDDSTRARTSQEATAEYATLRDEIQRRSTIQQALVVLYLGALASLAAAATKTGAPVANGAVAVDPPRTFYLIALIPMLAFSLSLLWIDHHRCIRRLGDYIREEIEPNRAMG